MPYGNLSNTATLLFQLLFFGCLAKTAIHFLVKKNRRKYGHPANTAKFFLAHW